MILNWIDGIVLFLIGISSVFGLFKGFIGVLLSLLGYVLSLYMTYLLQPVVYDILVEYIDYPMVIHGVSTSGLFILMLILFALFNRLIKSYLSLLNHHPMNYIMGLLLGALRGMVIVTVIFSVVSVLIQCVKGEVVFPDAVEKSSGYDYLVFGDKMLYKFMPENMKDKIKKFCNQNGKRFIQQKFVESIQDKLGIDGLNKMGKGNSPELSKEVKKLLKHPGLKDSGIKESEIVKLQNILSEYKG